MISLLTSADLWFRTVQAGATLALVSLGGYLVLRAGILNIGLEGVMLAGCFGAVLVDDKTGSAWLGMLGAAGFGLAAEVIFGLLTVTLGGNPIIIGLALNFLMSGLAAIALQAIYHVQGAYTSATLAAIPHVRIPGLADVPWLGSVLSGQSLLAYMAWLLALALPWWLASTRPGLTLRVAGVRPDVVKDVNRSVVRTQWLALAASGVLIGVGGAQLALSESNEFAEGMTAGRGFVAVALIIVVGRRAGLLVPVALAFALFDTLGFSLQTVGLPSELSGVVPYVAILAILLLPRARKLVAASRGPAVT